MKKCLMLILALILMLGLSACGEKWDAAIFYTNCSDSYTTAIRATLDQALTEAEISYTNHCCENDQAVQYQQIAGAVEQGCDLLVVNCATGGDPEVVGTILELAGEVPVLFFGSDTAGDALWDTYPTACFIGTDSAAAAQLQGEMIGTYLLENYSAVDLNADSVLTYAMFRGDSSTDAAYRTQYAVEDADSLLTGADRIALSYFDAENRDKYQTASWSAETAQELMAANLAAFAGENGEIIELAICNDDAMAHGVIQALNGAGYNLGGSSPAIPVFGFGGTEEAKGLVSSGQLTGTVDPHTDAIATAIATAICAIQEGAAPAEAIVTAAVADTELCALAYDSDTRLYVTCTAYTG